MAYVITCSCTKDEHCIETYPVNCIHPTKDEPDFATAAQLCVNPMECIDCGACVPVCPTTSIFTLEELPAELPEFVQKTGMLRTLTNRLPSLPESSLLAQPR